MHAGTSRDRRVCYRASGCREELWYVGRTLHVWRVSTAKCALPKIAKAVIASASASFRAMPRAPFDTRHGRGIAHPHAHAFAGELGQPQCVGVTASIQGIRISRARAGHGDNPHPYRPVRVSDPSNARGGSGARGARHGGAAASEPSPEFAGVFKPRIKPKLPLDHVVMMHQAYVETNPVPKSWDEGPPLDNGGASAGRLRTRRASTRRSRRLLRRIRRNPR